jgi:L-ascorbate metabolism protein UlaG (beta-lactamase superfamily)
MPGQGLVVERAAAIRSTRARAPAGSLRAACRRQASAVEKEKEAPVLQGVAILKTPEAGKKFGRIGNNLQFHALQASGYSAMSKESFRVVVRRAATILAALLVLPGPLVAAGPASVDITWMSISNIYYEFGGTSVLTDGYISRIPEGAFFGGGGGLARTRTPQKPDERAVSRVLTALGGPAAVNLLLTGHSHFDHSFDTATWSRLTGAPIVGSRTTCLQATAQGLPSSRCTAVSGGEHLPVAPGVTMWVVRWNHSGDPAINPEQHNAVELDAAPRVDPVTGGLRAGVAEDFPNGGGNRAFLFVVDGPDGRYSWFFQNSAGLVDLDVPIVVDGHDYGAPFANLKAAMHDAGVDRVDLWIGTGGVGVANVLLPVLRPKAYLPVHWDGLYGAFEAGVPAPYSDPPLERALTAAGVTLVKPAQYMDKWRLDRSGIRPVPNTAVKAALGFRD